ncbi:hypothetical protein RRG08_024080 [Elysia crispata]|uniref:Uncharacterized protein n=1 Tax=Elysia crispata TaxID=231223 RepID=A0AAE0ZNZ4_9GAST|nr:hypothetical protein RRG08_024080 [Elysia crispata]
MAETTETRLVNQPRRLHPALHWYIMALPQKFVYLSNEAGLRRDKEQRTRHYRPVGLVGCVGPDSDISFTRQSAITEEFPDILVMRTPRTEKRAGDGDISATKTIW